MAFWIKVRVGGSWHHAVLDSGYLFCKCGKVVERKAVVKSEVLDDGQIPYTMACRKCTKYMR